MSDEQSTPAAALDPLDMAVKRQLHEKADDRNRVEIRRGKPFLMCGARKKKTTGFCRSAAGMGTDHPGYGRCKFCGGSNTGPKTPEGKARSSQNARKHGFYSRVVTYEEREAYEEQLEADAMSLQHEIYLWKAKLLAYLNKWRKKWDTLYKKKLAEKYVKYKCTNPECGRTIVKGELEGKPGYCLAANCHEKRLERIDSWVADRTPEEAEKYADDMTKVFYSEGEGARSFYHAGSLEDRTVDRALQRIGNLVTQHARLKSDTGDDLLAGLNKELQQASQGRVSISWGGKPQTREGGPTGEETTTETN